MQGHIALGEETLLPGPALEAGAVGHSLQGRIRQAMKQRHGPKVAWGEHEPWPHGAYLP